MMGARWLCVAAGLWTVLGVGCKPPAPEARPESKLIAVPGSVEFGPSAVGVRRTMTVRLSNQGHAPLTLHGATTSLHGTATALGQVEVTPFEPFALEPEAEWELEVRFTADSEGELQGEVEVLTDATNVGSEGVLRLGVSGRGVAPRVEVRTAALDFGSEELGQGQARELRVFNPLEVELPIRLEFEGTDADQFASSEVGAWVMMKPGEERALPVRFEPKRTGAARAFARVEPCPRCEPLRVPLSGTGIASWLELTPSRVDFGSVTRGELTEQVITLHNRGSAPLTYGGVSLLDNESGAFLVVSEPSLPDKVLAAGASVEVRVGLSPVAPGPVSEARLKVDVHPLGATRPPALVPLAGEGGTLSCVVLSPRSFDFGVVAEGMSAMREVQVLNRCGADVLLSDVKATPKKGGDFVVAAFSSQPIPRDQSLAVPITYVPRAGTGASEAELTVKLLNGRSTFTETAWVRGLAKAFSPCQYALEPSAVEFGSVPVGSEVTLAMSVRNVGTTECNVTGMQLADGSDDAFRADKTGNEVLQPGQRAMLLVRFKPGAEGEFSGLAEGWVNHPSAGHALVPVHGQGVRGCFSVRPTTLDFGTTRLSCGPRERELVVSNTCPGPAVLMGLGLEGDASDFQVTHPFTFPATLPGGSQSHLKVTYAPTSDGEDAAALRFELGTGSPYTVGLVGRGVLEYERTDPFFQQNQAKVDVLFVVDNSFSMVDEQQNLGANLTALLSHALPKGVNYHVAVTTTGLQGSSGGPKLCPGGAEGGENGRLFPVDGSSPRIITPTTPRADEVFAKNTNVGLCHWDEQGLEAMYRALSDPLVYDVDDPRTPLPLDGNAGFLREDARLAIIVVSDDEDFSPRPVSAYETFLRGLKGGDRSRVRFSAIVGPEDLSTCSHASNSGTRYIQLAKDTGGVVENLCTPNWADSLERISENTFEPNRAFPLSEQPSDTTRIVVRVEGVEVKTGWTYDAATLTVLFEQGQEPPGGATVEVTYPVGC